MDGDSSPGFYYLEPIKISPTFRMKEKVFFLNFLENIGVEREKIKLL